MRVIFVGMHNKPGKMPLCHSTKSGALISRIIKKSAKSFTFLRTNLYDVDIYPTTGEKETLVKDWLYRIDPQEKDIVVLLGAEVHNNFVNDGTVKHIIKLPHPSSQRSHAQMDAYVKKAVKRIKKGLAPTSVNAWALKDPEGLIQIQFIRYTQKEVRQEAIDFYECKTWKEMAKYGWTTEKIEIK